MTFKVRRFAPLVLSGTTLLLTLSGFRDQCAAIVQLLVVEHLPAELVSPLMGWESDQIGRNCVKYRDGFLRAWYGRGVT